VAIQALESAKALPQGRTRAALALIGCVVATTTGAISLDLLGAARIAVMKPWLVAAVAGLLLHALSHVPKRAETHTPKHKLTDLVAGLLGLAVALVSLEHDGWVSTIGWPARFAGVVVLAAVVALNVYRPKKVAGRRARSVERDPRAS
jgi:ZIP family zinc transporter